MGSRRTLTDRSGASSLNQPSETSVTTVDSQSEVQKSVNTLDVPLTDDDDTKGEAVAWAPTAQQPRKSLANNKKRQSVTGAARGRGSIYILDKRGSKVLIKRPSINPSTFDYARRKSQSQMTMMNKSSIPSSSHSEVKTVKTPKKSNPLNQRFPKYDARGNIRRMSVFYSEENRKSDPTDLGSTPNASDITLSTSDTNDSVHLGDYPSQSFSTISPSKSVISSETIKSRSSRDSRANKIKKKKKKLKDRETFLLCYNLEKLSDDSSSESDASSNDDNMQQDDNEPLESDTEEEVEGLTNRDNDKLRLKQNDEMFHPIVDVNSPARRLMDFLTPYFLTNWILGRLPFTFSIDRTTGMPVCTLDRKTIRFAIFTFTSILMQIVLILVSISVIILMNGEVSSDDPFTLMEKLLLRKWWLSTSVFIFSLITTVVGSWSIIFYGTAVADYITKWFESMSSLGYDIDTKWLFWLSWMHPIITILNFGTLSFFFFTKKFQFRESTDAVAMLLFRNFIKAVYFNTIIPFPFLSAFVMLLQVYVFFSTRSFVFLVILFSRGIIHLATEWNTRLALKLRKVTLSTMQMTKEQLGNLKPLLGYKRLLKEHTIIVALLRGISGSFATILIFYILLECMAMAFSLFACSSGLLFNSEPPDNLTIVNGTDISYDKTRAEELTEVVYYLTSTIFGFSITSWSASGAGEVVMAGFETVRRHGLLLAIGPTERKFVLSLIMSFNAASPHLIQPGGYFLIDRGLIMGVFASAMTLYSIIIQCQIVRLINVPIIFKCYDATGRPTVCVRVESKNYPPIASEPDDPLDKLRYLSGETKQLSQKDANKAIEDSAKAIEDLVTLPKWNGPGFLHHFNLNETELERRCLHYCKGTFVTRVVAFNAKGKRYPFPENPVDCILKPYMNIKDPVVYNCRNVTAKERDDCSIINLSRDFVTDSPPNLTPVTYKLKSAMCYQDTRNFNPLEICNSPHSIIKAPCFGEALRRESLGLDSYKPTAYIPRALCNVSESSVDPSEAGSYELQKGVVTSFNVDVNGTTYKVWKLLALSYPPFDPSGLQSFEEFIIPLPREPLDKLYRPYAYIHPKLMSQESSYGYFDCFGRQQQRQAFDDCGNLGFSIVHVNRAGVKIRRTPVKERYTSASGLTYMCFESRFADYKCGVPKDLVDFACGKWKEYYSLF